MLEKAIREKFKMEEYNNQTSINSSHPEKNRRLFNRYLFSFLIIFLLVFSFYSGFKKGKESAAEKSVPFLTAEVENKNPNQIR